METYEVPEDVGEECLNLGERNNGGIAFEVNDNPGPASPSDDVIGEFASEQDGLVQVAIMGEVFGSVYVDGHGKYSEG